MKKLLVWTVIYVLMSAATFWSGMLVGFILDLSNLMRVSEIKAIVTVFLAPWILWTSTAPLMQFIWWANRRKTSKEEETA